MGKKIAGTAQFKIEGIAFNLRGESEIDKKVRDEYK